MQAEASKGLFYGWYIVGASVVGVGLSQVPMIYLSVGVFMIPLSEAFGWDRGSISLGISVGAVTLAVCMPLVGRLIDRFGARRVLLPSIVAYALAAMSLYFLSSSIWHFLGMFALIGLAGSGSNSMTYSRVLSVWFDRLRGVALGFAMSGIGLGSAISPVYAQWLIDAFDWRVAYLGLGLLVLFVGWPSAYFFIRDTPASMGLVRDGGTPEGEAGSPANTTYGLTSAEAVRTKEFWMMMAIFFVVALTLHGLDIHLTPLLRGNGLSAEAAAGLAGLTGIMTFVSRIGVGFFLDKFFAPRVGFLIFLAPLAAMAMAGSTDTLWLGLLLAVLLGIGSGAESDLIAYLISRYFGMKNFAELFGYIYASLMAGTAIGPYLWGVAYDVYGTYAPALWASIGGIVVILVILLQLGKYPTFDEKPALAAA